MPWHLLALLGHRLGWLFLIQFLKQHKQNKRKKGSQGTLAVLMNALDGLRLVLGGSKC